MRAQLGIAVGLAAVLVVPAGLALAPLGTTLGVVNGEFEIAAYQAKEPLCLAFGDNGVNVFEPGNPLGLPWLTTVNPCEAGAVKALQWSSSSLVQFKDVTGDGDREAVIRNAPPVPQLGNHNLWQAYPNPQQAVTANFQELVFRVEQGAIPPGAYVQISVSASPFSDVHPYVILYVDCGLTFRASMMHPDANGVVRLDPTQARFSSYYEGCDDEAEAWNAAATPEAKRDILDTLRLVQHSYWNWNTGTAPVVLDGIELAGARTVAEHAVGL